MGSVTIGCAWGLSLSARVEITSKYAQGYGRGKKDKGRILDGVIEVTGWNRDHARQQLGARPAQPKGRASATIAVVDRRRTKPREYSYDAVKVLQVVWATAGGSCGKYLAEAMTSGWTRWPAPHPHCATQAWHEAGRTHE